MLSNVLTLGALNLDIVAGFRADDFGLPMASWGADEERSVTDNEWWRIFYAYLSGREIHVCPGGSAANTGAALAALDHRLSVEIAGIRGQDAESEYYEDSDYWFGAKIVAPTDSSNRTGRALSYIGSSIGKRRIAVAPGVNEYFRAGCVPVASLEAADWLHASSFVGETANAELVSTLKRAREIRPDLVISMDPGPFLSRRGLDTLTVDAVEQCDYVLTKSAELLAIAGTDDTLSEENQRRRAAERLFSVSRRPLVVVVERIPRGFTVYRSDGSRPEVIEFEARVAFLGKGSADIAIKDDTGAGDVFNAAFIYGALRNLSPARLARLTRSVVDVHLQHFGRSGFTEFATAAPLIFASHSTKDKPYVKAFVDCFTGTELTFWLDEYEIPVGGGLRATIRKGIRESDAVAVFLTPDAIASGWVRDEIDMCIAEGVRWLPIKLIETDIPPELGDRLWLDVPRLGYAAAADLFRAQFRRD